MINYPARPAAGRQLACIAVATLATLTALSVGTPRAEATYPGSNMNRPGMSGDSVPWKGWSHVREHVEEVPGRAA